MSDDGCSERVDGLCTVGVVETLELHPSKPRRG